MPNYTENENYTQTETKISQQKKRKKARNTAMQKNVDIEISIIPANSDISRLGPVLPIVSGNTVS